MECQRSFLTTTNSTMAEIFRYTRSNSQDFDHDHCQKSKIFVVKMVNLKFDNEIEHEKSILTIDHGENSRVSWLWSGPYPPPPILFDKEVEIVKTKELIIMTKGFLTTFTWPFNH